MILLQTNANAPIQNRMFLTQIGISGTCVSMQWEVALQAKDTSLESQH